MRYDLTATEILQHVGFTEPVGQQALETLKAKYGISLPKVYQTFMTIAMDCPILGTSDLWGGDMIPFRMESRMLYERLSEAEKAQTGDYLEIGSDYGAGIVTFGLRAEDLSKDDPPVYLQHEADELTVWHEAYEKLSVFLDEVVISALALVNYSTAEDELEELGWTYTDYMMDYWETHDDEDGDDQVTEDTLRQIGLDPARIKWHTSSYNGKVFCCYDEQADTFYAGYWDNDEENTLYTITRTDEEDE